MFAKSLSEENALFYIKKKKQLTWYNTKIIPKQSSTNCS